MAKDSKPDRPSPAQLILEAAERAWRTLPPQPVNCWVALTAGDGMIRLVGLDMYLKDGPEVVAEHAVANIVMSPKAAAALVENIQGQLAGQHQPTIAIVVPGPERPQ